MTIESSVFLILCSFWLLKLLWDVWKHGKDKEESVPQDIQPDVLNPPVSISRLYVLRTNFAVDDEKYKRITRSVELWKKYGIDVIVLEPGMEFTPFLPNLDMQRYLDSTPGLPWMDGADETTTESKTDAD